MNANAGVTFLPTASVQFSSGTLVLNAGASFGGTFKCVSAQRPAVAPHTLFDD